MELRGTTILAVRTAKGVALGGDGQVTMGQTIIMKHTARKVRRLYKGAGPGGLCRGHGRRVHAVRTLRGQTGGKRRQSAARRRGNGQRLA